MVRAFCAVGLPVARRDGAGVGEGLSSLPLVRRPIRVSNGIGLALRWAAQVEGGGDMITQEFTETRQVNPRSRQGRPALTAVVAIIVLVGVAVVAWVIRDDEGPVAADEAQIEITYTDDGTSFVGDHEIIEGTVTVAFSNETDSVAIVAMFGYEFDYAGLAEELKFLEEGDLGVPIWGTRGRVLRSRHRRFR